MKVTIEMLEEIREGAYDFIGEMGEDVALKFGAFDLDIPADSIIYFPGGINCCGLESAYEIVSEGDISICGDLKVNGDITVNYGGGIDCGDIYCGGDICTQGNICAGDITCEGGIACRKRLCCTSAKCSKNIAAEEIEIG